MTSLVLKSPAKINLNLVVLDKRADGYHNIETIFERINIFDTISLTLTKNNNIKLTCKHPDVPEDERNLAYKAALLLKKKFAIEEGLDINIKKCIPVASGLGGGSSNAACVIEGMNKLFHLGLKREEMMQYGAKIGADVPFFLSGVRFAWATGKGERIIPWDIKTVFWHIVVVHKIKVLTKEVYQDLDKIFNKLTKERISSKIWYSALKKGDLLWMGKNCFNLLEKVTLSRFSQIKELKDKLKGLGLKVVLMSGSGPSVFGMVSTRKEAEVLCKRLQGGCFCQTFIARTY